MSHASRNVPAILFVLPAGSSAHSAGPHEESMRTIPYERMPMSRSFFPMAQDFCTCVRKFLRSSSEPMAEPPPVGPHTGATSEPMTRLREATLSARRLRSSLLESMSVCGRDRKMSTPSKRWPSTSAAAVRSSIVSRSITGSASGPPLPTSPGQVALCSFGYLYLFSALIDLLLVSFATVPHLEVYIFTRPATPMRLTPKTHHLSSYKPFLSPIDVRMAEPRLP